MRTIAVLNQKGGVGKTTTVANTAAALAKMGSKVLTIDLDPQAHLTIHLGLEPQTIAAGSYKVLTQSGGVSEQMLLTRLNLWLLPANIDLVGAETELVSVVGREIILREALEEVQDKFDICLIDCPPSLGLLTLNALAASQEVLIPLQPHFLALQGFGKLLQTVELVNKRINPELKVEGILLCMFDTRASLPSEVRADIEQFLSDARGTNCAWANAKILPTFIRRNIKLAEAPSYGKTIFEYEQGCHGAEDYAAVAEYIFSRFQKHAKADTTGLAEKVRLQDSPEAREPSPPARQAAPDPVLPAVQPQANPEATPKSQPQPARADVYRPQTPAESQPVVQGNAQRSPAPKPPLSNPYEYRPQSPVAPKPVAPPGPRIPSGPTPRPVNTGQPRPQRPAGNGQLAPSIRQDPAQAKPQPPGTTGLPGPRQPADSRPVAPLNSQVSSGPKPPPISADKLRPQPPIRTVPPAAPPNSQAPVPPRPRLNSTYEYRPAAPIQNRPIAPRNPQPPVPPQPSGLEGLRPRPPIKTVPPVPPSPPAARPPSRQPVNVDENRPRPPIEIRQVVPGNAPTTQQSKQQQPYAGESRSPTQIKPVKPPETDAAKDALDTPQSSGPQQPA